MIRIVKAVQTSVAAPEQWELWDDQGGRYYARHRHGRGVVYPVLDDDATRAGGPEEGVEWASEDGDMERILGEAGMKLTDDAEVTYYRLDEEEPTPLQARADFLAAFHPLFVVLGLLLDPRGAEKLRQRQQWSTGLLAGANAKQPLSDDLKPSVQPFSNVLHVFELNWAPGNYQWTCPRCGAAGNITPLMVRTPGGWHHCD